MSGDVTHRSRNDQPGRTLGHVVTNNWLLCPVHNESITKSRKSETTHPLGLSAQNPHTLNPTFCPPKFSLNQFTHFMNGVAKLEKIDMMNAPNRRKRARTSSHAAPSRGFFCFLFFPVACTMMRSVVVCRRYEGQPSTQGVGVDDGQGHKLIQELACGGIVVLAKE